MLGGIRIEINYKGEKNFVLLKSATKKKLAGDNQTLKFDINTSDYGVVEIPAVKADLAEEAIKKTKTYTKGFVFFSDSREAGEFQSAKKRVWGDYR